MQAKGNLGKLKTERKLYYHFKIHQEEDGGYWAECIELEGVLSQGDNLTELKENLEDALNLYLNEPDNQIEFPMPDNKLKGNDVISIPVEPRIAFSIYLKDFRKRKNLTQMEMLKILDINSLYTYQRFEMVGKANPTLKTLSRFIKVFPDFDVTAIFA